MHEDVLQHRSTKSNDTDDDDLSSTFASDSPSLSSDDSKDKCKVDLAHDSPPVQKEALSFFKPNPHQHEEAAVDHAKKESDSTKACDNSSSIEKKPAKIAHSKIKGDESTKRLAVHPSAELSRLKVEGRTRNEKGECN